MFVRGTPYEILGRRFLPHNSDKKAYPARVVIKQLYSYQIIETQVVQRVNDTINRINLYSMNSAVRFVNTYPLEGYLSVG